ncbi:ABC transporter permease [Halosimplex halophilum]|uniref:ABC transporter permease n=1 Tax=Halosimplex halophilum TaxID=2559572 RepID=UPI001FE54A0A|nr:ABC transporter permease [Halosimplex halophilum]
MSTDTAAPDGPAHGSEATGRDGERGTATLLTLLWAQAKKRLLLMYRYPLNTLSGLAMNFIFFGMVFFGGRAVAGQALTDSLGGIIVGYFLWSMALGAFSGVARSVTKESEWGTLEQLYMSAFGYGRVMVAGVAVALLETLVWGGATLAFMLAVTGESLHLPVATVLVLTVFAVAPAVGLGFFFGGLALVYKRVENIFNIMQFALIGLIAAPTVGVFWARLLPISQGSYLLTRSMAEGIRLWQIPPADLALLVGTAVGYFALGYAAFQWFGARARRQGLMGHY